ncbi:Zinc finger, CCCH-type [Parasponia andersonii]|uniref:Zinc finger, CCCH-type n=1 Tax=Parasponia andersonii TaxID=3476 RepID=A0A2P5BA34_PARAD|nr:Zinc finger, CCCH-type [Parasponia andersonii]
MEHSEQIFVTQNDAVLGFQHSPSPSSSSSSSSSSVNGDIPDPATSDLSRGAAEESGCDPLHEELGNLVLKDEKEEDPVRKWDLDPEEKEEEKVFEKELSGGEIGSRNGSEDENENGKGKEVEEGSDGGGGDGVEGEWEGWEENKNGNESENGNEVNNGLGGGGGVEVEKKNGLGGGGTRKYQYPVRPEAEDCSFYLKTGTCKFGSNCKFNHPVRRKPNQGAKEKVKEREESLEKPGQTECKYYLRSGGCKFGKACKYNHTRGKTSVAALAPALELNFVGLPIRVGEKECPYYMRTGSCKYGANCRFNHPDPTDAAGGDTSAGYGNSGPASLQGASQSTIPSWSSPRSLNETAPFVPLMLSPTQGVPSQNPEWNGYQAPVFLPERNLLPPPPAFVMNNPVTETNIYSHHPPQKQVEEYPERPGQPECNYFLKTGDCKFKSNCKYHHPKRTATGAPPTVLSDKGLPLRPDQNVCSHYSRYGICKFGPACKYDHPAQPTSSLSGVENQPRYGNSVATAEGAGLTRRSRSETTILQLV